MKTVTYDPALWQVVPKEPTSKMIHAGFTDRNGNFGSESQWKAMREAAPSPPEIEQEPVAYADSYGNVITRKTKDFSRNILTNSFTVPLYLHPAPEEIEALKEAIEAFATTDNKIITDLSNHVEALEKEIEALRRDADRWNFVLHLITHGVALGNTYSVWDNPKEVTRRIDQAMKESKNEPI